MQKKLMFTFGIILVAFIGLLGNMVRIYMTKGNAYSNMVLSQVSYVGATVPYKRGDITDRNGMVLATSVANYNVVVDPSIIFADENKSQEWLKGTSNAIEKVFAVDASQTAQAITDNATKKYLVIEKGVTFEKVQEFRALLEEETNIKGVTFELQYKRYYPYERMASHVLGYTNAGNVGTYGIEQYYNDYLNGSDGRSYGYYDNELNLVKKEITAVDGSTVVSTIDSFCQAVIEDEIEKFLAQYKVCNVGIVLANPNTGEIYAMSSNHEYNLNDPRDLTVCYNAEELAAMEVDDEDGTAEEKKGQALNNMWRNFCISDTYEPGSTFKLITAAGALEENAILSDDSAQFYCGGSLFIGGFTIRCHNRGGHGQMTLTDAIMQSCNVSFMEIGEAMGAEAFSKYQVLFNYGQKTGIDMPGESAGIIMPVESIGPTELATSTFGQSFNVSMIQMTAAVSSLVNGGYYYRPHVVDKVISESGIVEYSAEDTLMKLTVSKQTSDYMRYATEMVFVGGTAKRASVEGYRVGGKTGTAQKGNRLDDKWVLSLISTVPADNPQLVCYIVIDELDDETLYDSSHPPCDFTNRVLSRVLPHLGIYPEGEIDYMLGEFGLPDIPENPEEEGTFEMVEGDGTGDNGDGTADGTEEVADDGTTN